jgi:large subunit ribosomal protein L5
MSRLRTTYKEQVAPDLQKRFDIKNVNAIPRLDKVIVTVGTGKALKDTKLLDIMIENLRSITGQQPVKKAAKESISNFGVREGMTVGLQVTLRKERMYDFLDKLVNVTLPRLRDFNGIKRNSFDGKGNYSLGFKENNVFPEIQGADLSKIHGLGVTVSTTAENDEQARALLEGLGFPFTKEDNK